METSRIFMNLKRFCWHEVSSRYFKLSHGCKETAYKSGIYRHAYLGSREGAGRTLGRPCIYNGDDSSNTLHTGFFHCVNGKSFEAYSSAGPVWLPWPPSNYSASQASENSVIQRTEAWWQKRRQRKTCLRNEREVYELMYVCFYIGLLASAFEWPVRPYPFWKQVDEMWWLKILLYFCILDHDWLPNLLWCYKIR